jgi:predicted O-methyltransferase YrrM
VLEIGTLFGYSAIIMARALPDDGRLITLEMQPRHAEVAQANLQRAGVAERVEVRVGSAVDTLAGMTDPFDFVFIDADKASYPVYLDHALRLTRPGAIIVADNLWRHGEVLRAENEDNRGIAEFNRRFAAHPQLLSVILPTRGGEDATGIAIVK